MINNVVLVGRLTAKPELRQTQSGKGVTSFTLACDRQYGRNKEVDFISCVAWDKTAEVIVNYTDKGRLIAVDGRIQTRNYKDRDSKTVYVTEVVVNQVQLLSGREQTEQRPIETPQTTAQPFESNDSVEITADDLPF